jgi:hypothetical protein
MRWFEVDRSQLREINTPRFSQLRVKVRLALGTDGQTEVRVTTSEPLADFYPKAMWDDRHSSWFVPLGVRAVPPREYLSNDTHVEFRWDDCLDGRVCFVGTQLSIRLPGQAQGRDHLDDVRFRRLTRRCIFEADQSAPGQGRDRSATAHDGTQIVPS